MRATHLNGDRVFNPGIFATEIKVAMAVAKSSQAKLAKDVGCTQATISKIIRGQADNFGVELYLRLRKWVRENPAPQVE